MIDQYSNKKLHVCNKCNYKTHLLYSYKKHCGTELHKTGNRKPRSDKLSDNYKCEKCIFVTTNKSNFKVHVLNNHSTREQKKQGFKYYCDNCDFGVLTESSYKIHLLTQKHKMKSESI